MPFCERKRIVFKMFEAILAERDLFLPNRYYCLVSTFAEDRALKHLEAANWGLWFQGKLQQAKSQQKVVYREEAVLVAKYS